jgi:hypothetical protein
MIVETEQSRQDVVIGQEGEYLVVDVTTGECVEVHEINSELRCECFIAKVSPDGICSHLTAVEGFLIGADEPEAFNQSDADYYLSRISHFDAEIQDNHDSAKIQHQRIDIWLEKETNRLEQKKSYFIKVLEEWMKSIGSSTKNLVNGKLFMRKQPVQIDIVDEGLVINDARFRRIVPEKTAVDKRLLRKHIMATGEEVEGAVVSAPAPKFSYKLNPGGGG